LFATTQVDKITSCSVADAEVDHYLTESIYMQSIVKFLRAFDASG